MISPQFFLINNNPIYPLRWYITSYRRIISTPLHRVIIYNKVDLKTLIYVFTLNAYTLNTLI